MKHTFYMAALLAVVLSGCKNDTTPTPITKDTAAQNAIGGLEETAADENIKPKEGEIVLRLNYPVGFSQELSYVVNTKGEAMTGKVGVAVQYTVTRAANNAFTFTGQIGGISMVSETQGQTINFDSAKKLPATANDIEKGIEKQYKQIKDKPFTFVLNNKGAVEQEMHFSEQGMDQSLPFDLSTYQIQFPAKPVAVGATWTSSSKDKQVGGVRTNTYVLKQINDDTVVIAVKSVLPPPQMQGAKESVFSGNYTLDRATGMLISGSLSGTIETLGGSVTMTFTGKKK